jgi:hypothetical protein
MNFAWPLAAEAGLDTALHAIGHTLGLEHEHQHPHAGIAWNRQAVLDVFGAAPHHWTEAEIEWNVLRRLDAAEARRPHWDPDSVMGFGFDAGLIDAPAAFKSGHCPKGGLSYGDKAWVVEAYPGVRAPPVGSLKVGASQLLKLKAGETRVFDFPRRQRADRRRRRQRHGAQRPPAGAAAPRSALPAGRAPLPRGSPVRDRLDGLVNLRVIRRVIARPLQSSVDGPPRMVKWPTGSGGEPSSPNCVASAGGKARQPHILRRRS